MTKISQETIAYTAKAIYDLAPYPDEQGGYVAFHELENFYKDAYNAEIAKAEAAIARVMESPEVSALTKVFEASRLLMEKIEGHIEYGFDDMKYVVPWGNLIILRRALKQVDKTQGADHE